MSVTPQVYPKVESDRLEQNKITKLDSMPLESQLFRPGSETYPVFEVSTAILQQIFKLDGAVGHEVIITNWGVMEN